MILFLPYRAQIKLHKLPLMTIAVAVVCLVIYALQDQNRRQLAAHAERTCAQLAAESAEDGAAGQGHRWGRWTLSCEQAVLHIHFDPDPERHLAWHAEDMARRGDAAGAERLRAQYRAFAERAPTFLTARLWHDRSRFDPIGMITSSFAHAGWGHVIFNLVFFFAFAAAVELIIGPVLFLGVILVLSLGIGLFDQMVTQWASEHPGPTLGLSGVVMGMLGLFAYFLPRAKIRFFFWFIFTVGTVGVPAWAVGLWYVGWDLYDQLSTGGGYVNYVAHLAGAAFGVAIGLGLFREKRHWTKTLVLETVDLRQDEGWFTKLNAILTAPAVAGFAFLAGLFLLALLVTYLQHFGLQTLLVAPALAAAFQLYRSYRGERPDWARYREAEALIGALRHEEAVRVLRPLAEQGYPRAQFALGRLYAAGQGVQRDELQARRWYEAAAARGHAEAQYVLGTHYLDGRTTARDPAKAAGWLEQAAANGVPEAASSLGYLYEHGHGMRFAADREKAIEWYVRAAEAFLQIGRREDAAAVVRHLEAIAAGSPAVLGLVAKLKASASLGRGRSGGG